MIYFTVYIQLASVVTHFLLLIFLAHNDIDRLSWGDADWECQKRTGYLASIHSDLENKAFISWTDHKNVWIGLSRNGWGKE